MLETSGLTTEGTLAQASTSSLRLFADGISRDFLSSEVVQIDRLKPDPWTDGLLAGGLTGLAAGGALAAIFCSGSTWVNCSQHRGGIVATMGISAGISAGVGALLDLNHRAYETVYRAPRPSSRLDVSPFLVNKAKGVRVTLRF